MADPKSLESYKNDQYWMVQYGFDEQIAREKIYITLSTNKTISVTDDLITEFNITLLTYQNGDYIVDADGVKWTLNYDELQELVNTSYVETKYFWQLKNDKQAQILSATTSADVVAVTWNTVNPTIPATYPTFNYYTKTQTDSLIEGYATTATVNSHTTNTSNPHSVTKTQVGLSAVDNTSDVNKPISTATQTALNLKFDTSGIGNYATTATIYPYTDVKDPTGFTDPENITVTYNSTNRTVTLTGTVKALWRGQVVSVLVSGWVSDPHADIIDNNYFLYYNGSAFVWSTTIWSFDMLQICEVAYKTQAKYAIREVHSFMDYLTHSNLHYNIGTFKKSGGDFSSYTLNSTTVANRRPVLGSTVIVDEDIPTTNVSVSTGQYTRFNINGIGGSPVITVDQADFVSVGANGRANYNLNTAGTWSVTESANNSYGKWFIVNIPVTSDTESQKMRTIWIMPQTTSTTLATITAITPADINWGILAGAGTQEYVFVGEVVVQSTTNNWQLYSVKTLTGGRLSQVAIPSITSISQSVVTDDPNVMLERVINVACVSDAASAIPSTLAVIDGYTPVPGDLVLLRNNTASALQGVYLVQPAATPWTRAVEMDTVLEATDRMIKVNNGTTYKNTFWTVVTKGAITLGSTAIKFAQQFIDYAASLSLSTAGVLSVASSPTLTTARTIGTMTGDVTATGSTFNGSGNNTNSTTIANNAVTNAKAAQMGANTIKGNNTAGTANAVDMTVAQTLTLLGLSSSRICNLYLEAPVANDFIPMFRNNTGVTINITDANGFLSATGSVGVRLYTNTTWDTVGATALGTAATTLTSTTSTDINTATTFTCANNSWVFLKVETAATPQNTTVSFTYTGG